MPSMARNAARFTNNFRKPLRFWYGKRLLNFLGFPKFSVVRPEPKRPPQWGFRNLPRFPRMIHSLTDAVNTSMWARACHIWPRNAARFMNSSRKSLTFLIIQTFFAGRPQLMIYRSRLQSERFHEPRPRVRAYTDVLAASARL